MTVCPKCNHARTAIDDEFVSPLECPRCGIVYSKYIPVEGIAPDPASDLTSEEPDPAARTIWGLRILCSDGTCTGIIGPTGRCGVCGSLYADPKYEQKIEQSAHSLSSGTAVIRSFTDPTIDYEVSLIHITCTCPDFHKIRKEYGLGDPRRLCKHLVKACAASEVIPQGMDRYAEKISVCAEGGRGFPLNKTGIQVFVSGGPVEIWLPDDERFGAWVDVYWNGRRYGYNYREERWSYGEKPARSRTIVKAIHSLIHARTAQ